MSARGNRRHHLTRLKQKRFREEMQRSHARPDWALNIAVKRAHTGRLCSCFLCGNPRKYYGNSKASLTLQEMRHPLEVE